MLRLLAFLVVGRFLRRWRLDAPVTPEVPVFAKHFGRMLGATGAISALQRIDRTILVASPAGPLRMLGVQRKLLGHFWRFEKTGLAHVFSTRTGAAYATKKFIV